MVTTVFPENDGLLIEKPDSENAAALDNEHLVIEIDRQGITYIEEQPVTSDDIKQFLKTGLSDKPQLTVIIHADRRATTESLIDATKAGGLNNWAFGGYAANSCTHIPTHTDSAFFTSGNSDLPRNNAHTKHQRHCQTGNPD